ncbi:MAG TPA: hypothetical protein VJ844_04055 [Mucilaginibacter sp.]|nr:hypothetical protein [Mucilaginibacter sp.]
MKRIPATAPKALKAYERKARPEPAGRRAGYDGHVPLFSYQL